MASHCPACDHELPPEADRCPQCGISLREGATGTGAAPGKEEGPPVYRNLVTVYKGELAEILALQSALAMRGFETFVGDDHLKTIQPFLAGGYAFGRDLQAPAETAAEVGRLIAEIQQERAARKRASGVDRAREERTRQVTKLGYFAFIGMVFMFFYPLNKTVLSQIESELIERRRQAEGTNEE